MSCGAPSVKSSGGSGSAVTSGPAYTWVDSPAGLCVVARELATASRVAVDVEGDSLYHYRDKVCLLQLSTDDATYVIDTLALDGLSDMGGIMESPSVEKVFHAAGQDIAWLRRDYGFTVTRIFDTHVAAQFLGHERIGLDALLQDILGIAHSKHLQRADWSRRPLSPEQVSYAAMDTHHLLPLRDSLDARLTDKGRRSWAEEEFAHLALAEYRPPRFDPEGHRGIPGSRDLHRTQQPVVRALWALRDQVARDMDLPPFRVINNAVLLVIARRAPKTARGLIGCGVPRGVVERHGHALIAAIEEAQRAEHGVAPRHRTRFSRPSPDTIRRVGALKEWRAARARELGLPVGVVLPNGMLVAIATACPKDPETLGAMDGMRRWRVREFGEEILRTMGS